MSAVDLQEALRLVEAHGIAPLTRATASRPTRLADWPKWQAQLRRVEQLATAKLAEHGAIVTPDNRGGMAIRFAGYRATSTSGLRQALVNWRKRAELELARRECIGARSIQGEPA